MHDKKEEQLCHTVPKLCTAALQTKSQQLYHIYNVLFPPLRAASCFSFTLGNGSNAARLRLKGYLLRLCLINQQHKFTSQ